MTQPKIPTKMKINWFRLIAIALFSIVFGLITFGLPERICYYNGLGLDCLYGYIASYFILGMFLIVLFPDIAMKKGEDTK